MKDQHRNREMRVTPQRENTNNINEIEIGKYTNMNVEQDMERKHERSNTSAGGITRNT